MLNDAIATPTVLLTSRVLIKVFKSYASDKPLRRGCFSFYNERQLLTGYV